MNIENEYKKKYKYMLINKKFNDETIFKNTTIEFYH